MTTRRDIRRLAQRIAREFKPRRIILFGSHAYGKPDDDSDVDLLVLMPYQGHAARLAGEILLKTDPVFAVDIMVRSPDEFRERYRRGDAFIREIIDRGQVLYEPRRSCADRGQESDRGRDDPARPQSISSDLPFGS